MQGFKDPQFVAGIWYIPVTGISKDIWGSQIAEIRHSKEITRSLTSAKTKVLYCRMTVDEPQIPQAEPALYYVGKNSISLQTAGYGFGTRISGEPLANFA